MHSPWPHIIITRSIKRKEKSVLQNVPNSAPAIIKAGSPWMSLGDPPARPCVTCGLYAVRLQNSYRSPTGRLEASSRYPLYRFRYPSLTPQAAAHKSTLAIDGNCFYIRHLSTTAYLYYWHDPRSIIHLSCSVSPQLLQVVYKQCSTRRWLVPVLLQRECGRTASRHGWLCYCH